MNLNELDLPTLLKIAEDLPSAIARKKSEERNAALAEVKEVARKRGFALSDLFGDNLTNNQNSSRRGRSTLPVKFQHPNDPSLTWTGRGRKPQWIIDWEGSGRDMAALAV